MIMNKKTIISIISLIFFAFIACALIYTVTKKQDSNLTDNVKFSQEYTKVEEDNLFVYTSLPDIIKVLEHGTGVVYLGFQDCSWCQEYVPMLNQIAKEQGISKIHYYNILEDRKNNTADYQKVVELLKDELLHDNDGNLRIYVPDITVVKEGKIIGHDNEGSFVTKEDGTPEEYWTEAKRTALKNRLTNMISEISESSCSSCNE